MLPVHTGVYSQAGVDKAPGTTGPSLDIKLLPQLLAPAGYISHAIGKWHLGSFTHEYLPSRRGFSSYLGYLGGGEDYYYHDSGIGAKRPGNGSWPPPPSPHPTTSCYYRDFWTSNASTGRPGGPARDPAYFPPSLGAYSTELFTARAVEVIDAHPSKTKSLFLYAAYQAAHSPNQVPNKYTKRYESYEACQRFRTGGGSIAAGPGYVCTGLKTLGGGYCPCNRMVVSAMVSALDDGIGAIVTALKRNDDMWSNTVLVFSGDNGGPQILGHHNSLLRGGKWTWFEGGVRPAAFVASPLLPAAIRSGKGWHNGTMHLVDWSATFLRLAGLNPPTGNHSLDGVDQWDALVSTDAAFPSPRKTTLLAKGVLVDGIYKLSTVSLAGFGECADIANNGVPRQGWDCLLGTHGGWLPPFVPGDVHDNLNLCMPDKLATCPNISSLSPVDQWLCEGQCNATHPCLYDVVSDPGEHFNLASTHSVIVSRLSATFTALEANIVYPHSVKDPNNTACRAFEETWGSYFGPWTDVEVV